MIVNAVSVLRRTTARPYFALHAQHGRCSSSPYHNKRFISLEPLEPVIVPQRKPTWVALFGGLNVDYGKKLPRQIQMGEMRSLFAMIGLKNVRSLYRAGNFVFESDFPREEIATRMGEIFAGIYTFRPSIHVFTPEELAHIFHERNPFRNDANFHNKNTHVFFLSKPPPLPDLDTLKSVKSQSEKYKLCDHDGPPVFYLLAPAGLKKSDLVTNVERCLGVTTTLRCLHIIDLLLVIVRNRIHPPPPEFESSDDESSRRSRRRRRPVEPEME